MASSFPGTDGNYLSRSSGTLLNHNAAYTESAWIRTGSSVDGTYLIFKNSGAATSSTTAWQTADYVYLSAGILTLSVFTGGGTGSDIAGSTTLTANKWYHLALVRESATSCKLYLNGSLEITHTQDIAGRASTTMLLLGTYALANQILCWNGRMAAVKLFSASQTIEGVANEGAVIRPVGSSLYSFAPMFSGERTKDFSGNGYDWTETGTLTDEDPPPIGWGAPVIIVPYVATVTTVDLAASLSASIDATAAPSVTKNLAASLTASVDGTAVPSVTKPLAAAISASVDATSTATVTKNLQASLAPSIDGTTALSVTKALTVAIAASVDGTAPLTVTAGVVALVASISASVDGTVTLTLTKNLAVAISASIDGTAALATGLAHYRVTETLVFTYTVTQTLIWPYAAVQEVEII